MKNILFIVLLVISPLSLAKIIQGFIHSLSGLASVEKDNMLYFFEILTSMVKLAW